MTQSWDLMSRDAEAALGELPRDPPRGLGQQKRFGSLKWGFYSKQRNF